RRDGHPQAPARRAAGGRHAGAPGTGLRAPARPSGGAAHASAGRRGAAKGSAVSAKPTPPGMLAALWLSLVLFAGLVYGLRGYVIDDTFIHLQFANTVRDGPGLGL